MSLFSLTQRQSKLLMPSQISYNKTHVIRQMIAKTNQYSLEKAHGGWMSGDPQPHKVATQLSVLTRKKDQFKKIHHAQKDKSVQKYILYKT